MNKGGAGRFGSGWMWLVERQAGHREMLQAESQAMMHASEIVQCAPEPGQAHGLDRSGTVASSGAT